VLPFTLKTKSRKSQMSCTTQTNTLIIGSIPRVAMRATIETWSYS